MVAHDGPKDYACDGGIKLSWWYEKQRNPRKFPATKVSWYTVHENYAKDQDTLIEQSI